MKYEKMSITWLAFLYLTWKDGGGCGGMIGHAKQINNFFEIIISPLQDNLQCI